MLSLDNVGFNNLKLVLFMLCSFKLLNLSFKDTIQVFFKLYFLLTYKHQRKKERCLFTSALFFNQVTAPSYSKNILLSYTWFRSRQQWDDHMRNDDIRLRTNQQLQNTFFHCSLYFVFKWCSIGILFVLKNMFILSIWMCWQYEFWNLSKFCFVLHSYSVATQELLKITGKRDLLREFL